MYAVIEADGQFSILEDIEFYGAQELAHRKIRYDHTHSSFRKRLEYAGHVVRGTYDIREQAERDIALFERNRARGKDLHFETPQEYAARLREQAEREENRISPFGANPAASLRKKADIAEAANVNPFVESKRIIGTDRVWGQVVIHDQPRVVSEIWVWNEKRFEKTYGEPGFFVEIGAEDWRGSSGQHFRFDTAEEAGVFVRELPVGYFKSFLDKEFRLPEKQ